MTTPDTQLQHLADDRKRHYGVINTPVYRASLFGFETYADFLAARAGTLDAPIYSRGRNPTRDALEAKIAFLEEADRAIAFSSGMGAISASLLALLKAGDHALVAACCYGPTRTFFDTVLTNLGVTAEYFPPEESVDLSARLKPNTRLIYLESPGSLTFQLQNIRAVTKLARQHQIATVIDNSWATPLYQKPLSMGVDVVVHSGTKYISGHSDVIVGLLACNIEMYDRIKPVAKLLGASLAPDDAYLVTRGLRTLPVRLARQEESALNVARWLENQPEVRAVLHPGLPSFSQHDLAKAQMHGSSSLFGLKLHPGGEKARHAFVDSLSLFSIAVSWGGFESLILPMGQSYQDQPAVRQAMDIDDDLFRLSIGLEGVDDLIADLEAGLAAWRRAAD